MGTVLGAKQVDEWFGTGTALKIWETTKRIGGYRQNRNTGYVYGVGFSDNGQDQIFSGEWTLGAVNLLKSLASHYSTQKKKLLTEAAYMRAAVDQELLNNIAPSGLSILYAN